MVPVNDLTPLAVQTARDAMKETPVMANQMLAVGRTIWDWAIPLDLAKLNPFEKIKDIDVPDRGHVPWPSWVIDYVREQAWPDLVRMERLGIMTCQRGSDMVEMGPEHRDGHGIWSRPKKTRKRRRAFLIPLNTADALELDRWAETPVTFTNSRWKQPIARHRADLYLYSSKGAQYTPDGLRARYGRWLEDTEEGRQLCKRWKEWVTGQVKKYFWDIDPEDADHPSIHGLRGTGSRLRGLAWSIMKLSYSAARAIDCVVSVRRSGIRAIKAARLRPADATTTGLPLSVRADVFCVYKLNLSEFARQSPRPAQRRGHRYHSASRRSASRSSPRI